MEENCCSRSQTVMTITHVMAIHVDSRILWMQSIHHHKLHVFRRFPVPFSLVDEPIIYLFLV